MWVNKIQHKHHERAMHRVLLGKNYLRYLTSEKAFVRRQILKDDDGDDDDDDDDDDGDGDDNDGVVDGDGRKGS